MATNLDGNNFYKGLNSGPVVMQRPNSWIAPSAVTKDSGQTKRPALGVGGVAFDHGCLPKIIAVHTNQKQLESTKRDTTSLALQNYLHAKQKRRRQIDSRTRNYGNLCNDHDYASKNLTDDSSTHEQLRIPSDDFCDMLTAIDESPTASLDWPEHQNHSTAWGSGQTNSQSILKQLLSSTLSHTSPRAEGNLYLQSPSNGHPKTNAVLNHSNSVKEWQADGNSIIQHNSPTCSDRESWQRRSSKERLTVREKTYTGSPTKNLCTLFKTERRAELLYLLESTAMAGREKLYCTVENLLSKKLFKNTLRILELLKTSDISEANKKKILSVVKEKVLHVSPNLDLWKRYNGDSDHDEIVMIGKNHNLIQRATSRVLVKGTFNVPSQSSALFEGNSECSKNAENKLHREDISSDLEFFNECLDALKEATRQQEDNQIVPQQTFIEERPRSLLQQLRQMSPELSLFTQPSFPDEIGGNIPEASIVGNETRRSSSPTAVAANSSCEAGMHLSERAERYGQLQKSEINNNDDDAVSDATEDCSSASQKVSSTSSSFQDHTFSDIGAGSKKCSGLVLTGGKARNRRIEEARNIRSGSDTRHRQPQFDNDSKDLPFHTVSDKKNLKRHGSTRTLYSDSDPESQANVDQIVIDESIGLNCTLSHNGSPKRMKIEEDINSTSNNFVSNNSSLGPKNVESQSAGMNRKHVFESPTDQSTFDSAIAESPIEFDAAICELEYTENNLSSADICKTVAIDDNPTENVTEKQALTLENNECDYDEKIDAAAKNILNQFADQDDDIMKNIFDLLE